MREEEEETGTPAMWSRRTRDAVQLRYPFVRMRALELLLELCDEGLARRGALSPEGEPTFVLTAEGRSSFRERFWEEPDDG